MKKLLLLLLLIPNLVIAEIPADSEPIGLNGTGLDCGYWLNARDKKGSRSLEDSISAFTDGYAMASGRDVWRRPKAITETQLYYIVDRECRKDPTQIVWVVLGKFLFDRKYAPKQ
jgi:hypothetical protein